MAGKIFVNYRWEDARADARNIRDRLASVFGASNVFMDVDNLEPGQRFDYELAKALRQCAVFLVVIGPRWLALLEKRAQERAQAGVRDYVREEIEAALSLGIVVMPVLIDGASLPLHNELPADIRALAMHQKQDIAHDRFGRDMSELIEAIKSVRQRQRRPLPWRTFAVASVAAASVALMVGGARFLYPSKQIVATQVEGEEGAGIKKRPDGHLAAAKQEEDRKLQEEMMRAAEAKRLEDERRAWEVALAAERKRVEEAKDSQEAKRLEKERAELLARNDELRKALDEARTAREATKAVEETLSKQRNAEKTSDPTKVAALPKPDNAPSANPFNGVWRMVGLNQKCGPNDRFARILVIRNGAITAEMGAGGVRGSVSSSGVFHLTHLGKGGGTMTYTGTLRDNSGSGSYFHSYGPCTGTFTLTRR